MNAKDQANRIPTTIGRAERDHQLAQMGEWSDGDTTQWDRLATFGQWVSAYQTGEKTLLGRAKWRTSSK